MSVQHFFYPSLLKKFVMAWEYFGLYVSVITRSKFMAFPWFVVLVLSTGTSCRYGVSQSISQSRSLMILVDSLGLTLENGTYGNIINGQSFQQDALISTYGWQYIAYYNSNRHVCIGRRKLSGKKWEIVELTDYKIGHNDAHNTISLGVCEKDGTLHLVFDEHASPLRYRYSKKPILTTPEDIDWNSSLFSAVQNYLIEGEPIKGVTYPRFVSTPQQDLILGWRNGVSANGGLFLATYSGAEGKWSDMHQVISGEGEYIDPVMGISKSRNPYLNSFSYDNFGKLHITWNWRESLAVAGNRDIEYAYSPDNGSSWYNMQNECIAFNRINKVINTSSSGITLKELDLRYGTMNNQAQVVDSKGNIHVVMYHKIQPDKTGWAKFSTNNTAYFHYYTTASGEVKEWRIPAIGNRPKLLIDRSDNLYLIFIEKDHFDFVDEGAPLVVMKAEKSKAWKEWEEVYRSKDLFFNEVQVDWRRFEQECTMSVLVQKEPFQAGEAATIYVFELYLKDEE